MKLFFRALFLLIGTIIGSGVFALPYVVSKSGLLPFFFGILFLGLVTMSLNLFYAEIVLKTSGDHQLPGYVSKYLGGNWMKVSLLFTIVSLSGALLSYVVLGGEFLALAAGQISHPLHSFWFYLAGVVFFWQGFKKLTKVESFLTALLLFLMIVIPFKLLPFVRLENIVLLGSRPLFFWGAALFSLIGFSVIPEVEEVLRKKRDFLVPVIVIGSLVPVALYLFFTLVVWGASGGMVTVDALSGLVAFSPLLSRLGAVIGLLALITSFLSLVNVSKEVYFRDLRLPQQYAKLLAIIPGFFGIFLSPASFISIISYTGAISLAISGTMINLIFLKMNKKFFWLVWPVNAVLILGVVFVLASFRR
ncbi:MAG: aromatic amino acid transport family protein [Patescibacteria group bacterium]|nr:amino acid permease [Patescibacteria group bacterium]